MKCPTCLGPVELPEPHYPAWCPACDLFFRPVADIGWWNESIVIYALEGE